jgi:hypothetical protein
MIFTLTDISIDDMKEIISKHVRENVYQFALKNISIYDIEEKYKLGIFSNLESGTVTDFTTEVDSFMENPVVSFMDVSKKIHDCVLSSVDYTTGEHISKDLYCFWDRFPCMVALGCPIDYREPVLTKKYHSEINKDTYTIKEKVCKSKSKNIKESSTSKKTITLEKNSYYITDGSFCSWNCMIAWINSNSGNPMYADSIRLVLKWYNEIYTDLAVKSILPSDHWRLIQQFGGHMNINEFRSTLDSVKYIPHGTMLTVQPISYAFEKEISF